jgi:hypothetical protein
VVRELLPHFNVGLKNKDGKTALGMVKESIRGRWCDDPARLRDVADFLSAYERSLKEMAQISWVSKPAKQARETPAARARH